MEKKKLNDDTPRNNNIMKRGDFIIHACIVAVLFILLSGCKKGRDEEGQTPTGPGSPCPGIPTVTYGGQVYNTVHIGNQCWLKENLNIGTMIPGEEDMQDNNIIEKYCYDDVPANCTTYGGLYQWDEIMQYTTLSGTQGVCPPGWQIPTDDDWKILEGTVDSIYDVGDVEWNQVLFRGFDAGRNLKSTSGWYGGGNGPNEFGFAAMPAGSRGYVGGFYSMNKTALYWSSQEYNDTTAWSRVIEYSVDNVYRDNIIKSNGFSVRCIKD